MKLYFSQTSPFARKVAMVAHERGLWERIEVIPANTSPVQPHESLAGDNPLAKIPCLILEDGSALYDSRVIAEYLDALAGAKLFPGSGAARWTALRQQALADGLLEAAVLVRYERVLRPDEKCWPEWIDGQFGKIRRALDALESETASLEKTLTIGPIAAACALGYLDFRFADFNWRSARPRLTLFYAKFGERPSMRATRPPEA
ncbi:MAG: glutathione S-transferase [Alphaproteobacteria bacterium]